MLTLGHDTPLLGEKANSTLLERLQDFKNRHSTPLLLENVVKLVYSPTLLRGYVKIKDRVPEERGISETVFRIDQPKVTEDTERR